MKKLCVTAVSAVALLGQISSAWTAETDPFSFFEEEAKVTAASQHPQKISEAPATAYVISADDIDRYGYRTVAEALQSVPGIYATNDRNYTYLWFRGFGRPSDYNNRVLLLIDGHRMNDAVYGGAYVANELPIDIRSVSRIEVIKGPASSLYGDSAFFGVVNIVTKSASEAPAITAAAEGGSFGTRKGFVGAAHTSSGGATVYAAASYRRMDGQSLNYPEYSSINGGDTSRAADAEENRSYFGKLSYAGFTLSANDGTRIKHVPTGSFGTDFNNTGTRTNDAFTWVELAGQHRLASAAALTSRLYFNGYRYRARYYEPASTPGSDPIPNTDFATAKAAGEELHLRLTPWGEANGFTLGEEFERTMEGLQKNYDAGSTAPAIDVDTRPKRWAGYLQQEWQATRSLSLNIGGRIDHYETFGKTINPRLAAIQQVGAADVIKALYGTAFRAPSAYEMFYGDALSFAPNPDLRPEKISGYELVWERQFQRRGMASLSAYSNRVTGLIDQTVLPDGRITFENQGTVHSLGTELYTRWNWGQGSSAFAGYNLQRTRDADGHAISNSPEHSGSAGVSERFQATQTTVSLEAFFIGPRQTVQDTRLPYRALVSLTLRKDAWGRRLTFFGSIYNLFDANYAVSGASEHLQPSIAQDGRNFNAGIEYRFR